MEFKGKKEKWEVFTDSYTNKITIYPSDSTVAICYMANTYKKDKYDALLISKAHEMLEMLQRLRKDVDFGFSSWGNDKGLMLSEELDSLIKEATEL